MLRRLGVHAAAAWSINVCAIKLTAPRRPSAARRWQLCFLAPSAPCVAACIEVAVEAAAHGCCVAQKRQLDCGCFLVFAGGAVIQNLGFLGGLRRSWCGFAVLVGCGEVALWCGLMLGGWRRCRRRRRAGVSLRVRRSLAPPINAAPQVPALCRGCASAASVGTATPRPRLSGPAHAIPFSVRSASRRRASAPQRPVALLRSPRTAASSRATWVARYTRRRGSQEWPE